MIYEIIAAKSGHFSRKMCIYAKSVPETRLMSKKYLVERKIMNYFVLKSILDIFRSTGRVGKEKPWRHLKTDQ